MRISSITKNAGKACNNRLYRHIRTFKKIVKNYFVIYGKSLYGIKNRTFRRTGFYEYAKVKRFLDPVSFFEMVRERPYLERLIKAGLYHLAEDIMDNKAQIYPAT